MTTIPSVRPVRTRVPQGSARSRVLAVAGAAAGLRLLLVAQPLSSDEGGFLLVASQWAPGGSLYGAYWVDRPPLLIDFFDVAGHLGGATALRVMGAVLVALSVLVAGRIGTLVRPGRHPVLAAVTAATFLVSPLSGGRGVNGELIAVPCVLLGIMLVLHATRAPEHRTALMLGAGAAGAAAALVKQSELDVFVVVAVGLLTTIRTRGAAAAGRDLRSFAAGASMLTAAVLADSASRGTTLHELWTAVVAFRLHASEVISSSASPATAGRLQLLVVALLVSGSPLLVGLFLRRLRTSLDPGTLDVRWQAVALLGWESIAVLGGGSYWLHYLVSLVPGLVLAVAATRADRAGARVLTYAALAAAVSIAYVGTHASSFDADRPLVTWLTAHARPHDTAVVAYGHPEILWEAGLASPYEEVWSLPVRVRDPALHTLAGVLAGGDRPDWVVTFGDSLATWGVDPAAGQAQLDAHYHLVADVDRHRVYHALGPTP